MAEVEKEEHKETMEDTPSSPDSTTVGANGLKAAKDRTCPFCKQAFTSSSLGRHLDLYIKPRNPKPPDGVHNVDEIRKIRGAITRRQPRTGFKAQARRPEEDQDKKGGGAWPDGPAQARPSNAEPARSPREGKEIGLTTYFNAANWQATGVINNLPPREPSRTPHDQSGRNEPSEYSSEDLAKLNDAAEAGRAAEMALRDLLTSLEAAKKKAEPLALFDDFDFFSLAFPGLCLAVLPPPPAIFSTTPFAVAHTWSLSPPGEQQRAALVRALYERSTAVRSADPEAVGESCRFRYQVHLDGAYEKWQTLSDADRAAAWTLEISRAFSKERDKTQRLQGELELAQQRIRHLEAEYDRMSRCQLPREYLLHPPTTIPMTPGVIKELKPTDLSPYAAEGDYDADALLARWKTAVKTTARPPRPHTTQPHYVETRRSELKDDMYLSGMVVSINGPMPRNIEGDYQQANPSTPRPLGPAGSPNEGDVEEVPRSFAGDSGTSGNYSNQGALTKLRHTNDSFIVEAGSSVNGNGKRPLSPSLSSALDGKRSMQKIYREQRPGAGV